MYRHTVLELIVNVLSVFLRPTQNCLQTMLSGAIMWCFLFLYFSSCLSSLLVDWWSLATAPRFVPLPSDPDFLKVFISISYCSTCFSFIFSTLFYSLWNLTEYSFTCFSFQMSFTSWCLTFCCLQVKTQWRKSLPKFESVKHILLVHHFFFIYRWWCSDPETLKYSQPYSSERWTLSESLWFHEYD